MNLSFGKTLCTVLLTALAVVAAAHADDDPPERVMRLSLFDGTVTFAPSGSDEWAYASLNRPLTTGDRLWVDRGSRAELHAGGTALRLGAQTSVDLLTLTDDALQAKVGQGTAALHVRSLWDGQTAEIDTPNLALVMHHPGAIRVDVTPGGEATTVAVRGGDVDAIGADGSKITLSDGETIRFSGTRLTETDASDALTRDSFDDWVASRDRREDRATSVHYVSREVIGYEDLDDYGHWRVVSGYGPVWTPATVAAGWAPYRYGHWVWVAPWGWSWVDDAPWGFAPFHYGRWAYIGSNWCWVPGAIGLRPVYAPALVAFAAGGGGSGVHWGISLSVGTPGVAWFPLGPGEIYRPAYRVSNTYVNNINHVTNITNTTVVNNVYINQNAPNGVTAVTGNHFVTGQPVQNALAPINPAQLKAMQTVGSPPIAPTQQSLLGGRIGSSAPVAPNGGAAVVTARAPIVPPAMRDRLARQYSDQGGSIGGPLPQPVQHVTAGPSFVPGVKVAPAASSGIIMSQPAASVGANLSSPVRPASGRPDTLSAPGSVSAPGRPVITPERDDRRGEQMGSRPASVPPVQPTLPALPTGVSAVPRPPIGTPHDAAGPQAAEPRLAPNAHRETLREGNPAPLIERQPDRRPFEPEQPAMRQSEPVQVAPRAPVHIEAPHAMPVQIAPHAEPGRPEGNHPEPKREKERDAPGKGGNERRDRRDNRD